MVVRKPRRVVWPTERERMRTHLCVTEGRGPNAIGKLTTMGIETSKRYLGTSDRIVSITAVLRVKT